MNRLVLLAIVSWSVLPYKAWSRLLVGGEGFNLGDLAYLLILVPVIVRLFSRKPRDLMSAGLVIILVTLGVSMLKGLVWGENLRDILRIVRATAAWAVIPLIVEEIRDEAALRKLLAGLATVLVIVSVTIILFSWDPGLVPPTDDMAVAREEWFGGFQRIFHVGMWGAVAGAIVALGVGFYDARWRTAGPLIGLVLCFGLFFTFVRTFIMLVIMSVGIFVLDRTRFNKRAMTKPLATAVVLLLLFSALPLGEKVMTAVSDRMSSVLSADVTEIDPTDQEGLGTLVWRILEADASLGNLHGTWDNLFGAMGRSYTMDDGFTASTPHISYVGIYYCGGALGFIGYLFFLAVVTARLASNIRRERESELSWVHVPIFVTWIMLLAGALNAALFQFPYGVFSMAVLIGISEAAQSIAASQRMSPHAIA